MSDPQKTNDNDAEQLYRMNLHDGIFYSKDDLVLRVPGGWIYSIVPAHLRLFRLITNSNLREKTVTHSEPPTTKPKIKKPTRKEYRVAEYNLLTQAIQTRPCIQCKWPVLNGYCCEACGSACP